MRSHPLVPRCSWRSGIVALALLCAALPVAIAEPAPARNASESAAVLGRLEFPTSTRSAPAQAAFVRGMLWLHLFEYEHALKEFQQAERLDAGFAMAYWGEAMCATHAIWNQDDPATARAALARLGPTPEARAAKAGSARERAWLDAVEKLYGPGTLRERDERYLAAIQEMAKAYPKDDEVQLFHALALLGVTRGARDIPNYLRAAEISKRVLEHNPKHPGAAHYWIHGMDDPAHAAGALPAAYALSKIAPGAGHAQHMVSHIFMALGMWDEVVSANEAAMRVVAEERQAAGQPQATCGHYAEWLQYTLLQQGRPREAQQVLLDCSRDGPAAVAWMQANPGRAFGMAKSPAKLKQRIDQSLIGMRAFVVLEAPAYRDAAVTLAIDNGDAGRYAGWDAFALGWAAAEKGDLAAARTALATLQSIAGKPPGPDEFPNETQYLEVIALQLQAVIAKSSGEGEAALAAAGDAATRYDALPFDFGPPVTIKPPREQLGELLLAAGRPKDAALEFERALKAAPSRALSLLGRARSLAASGDAAAAAKAYEQLRSIWHQADADLPALAEVR